MEKIIATLDYKGWVITKFEDGFGQEFVRIGEAPTLFASVADAKRVINGKKPRYEIV